MDLVFLVRKIVSQDSMPGLIDGFGVLMIVSIFFDDEIPPLCSGAVGIPDKGAGWIIAFAMSVFKLFC